MSFHEFRFGILVQVLDLRWSKAGDFRLVTYEPGDWEELLEQIAIVF